MVNFLILRKREGSKILGFIYTKISILKTCCKFLFFQPDGYQESLTQFFRIYFSACRVSVSREKGALVTARSPGPMQLFCMLADIARCGVHCRL
jgi:hypothetical protein